MLIIFDLDGTLINADWEKLFEAYQAIIAATGQDWRNFFRNLDEFKRWWNPDWRVNYQKAGIADEEKANRIFYQIYNPCVYLFPWVDNILKKLTKNHLITALTNRHRKGAEEKYLAPV